jgi:putative endonuclease
LGCTFELKERLIKYNQKSKGLTKSINHWKVVYIEKYNTKEKATKGELQIKS